MRVSILTLVALSLALSFSALPLLGEEAGAPSVEASTLDPVVRDVVLLLESGVEDGVIESWLKKRGVRPGTLGVDDLIALKKANAPDALVKSLVLLSAPAPAPTPPPQPPLEPAKKPARVEVVVPSAAAPPQVSEAPRSEPPPRAPAQTTADRVRRQVDPLVDQRRVPTGEGADADAGARDRLVSLLVSDAIQRVQFEGTSVESVAGRVDTAVARILEDGTSLGETPGEIAEMAEQIILGINDLRPNLEERTLGPNSHNLLVRNIGEAKTFGNVVNLLGSIIRRASKGAEDRFSARGSTARILDQFVFDPAAMDFPLLFQYEENLKNLAMEPTNKLQSLLVAK